MLAHETGHIAGGHLSKLRDELAKAQTASIIALLLGVGALAAGARGGPSNNMANIGAAAIQGPQERSAGRCSPISARRKSRRIARA